MAARGKVGRSERLLGENERPAVEPPNNSTWRSSALAGTTEQMMSAAVTRRGRAAGALCGAGARKQR
ncbi:hypothetical protein EMIHUDRAFT_367023 [Emiliania huxleyi CCMP1516]|uniref:Uncharacterized protein n=2 Tax=Emiliania huxleyi TaxID=2903 RepID=A0A0D3JRS3_EMIH1|nr:hypothetical protein EMIHUDRAFT_367023 [Emiliania huxleyi CCMP1516]EOD26208.1 hypothetical protein EMIHUDRAFT_367023 [Emiliania huxleyi CCMP1516]|eukprot:XP_005778637.1 hypothetical protein EMIHUDRAFT_367023 [Emiliania huxleyi CCMP1516]